MDTHPYIEKTINLFRRQVYWRTWLPSRGNVVFVLFVVGALLFYVNKVGAVPSAAPSVASTSAIPYQGRLADAGGNPLDGSYSMTFKLYGLASGGSALWTETWSGGNSVVVSKGLFNVMLGSLTPLSANLFVSHSSLWLGSTVGTDSEMTPRTQLGSAPYSMQAQVLPSASITTTMIADGAVSFRKQATYPQIYSSSEVQGSTSQPQAVSMVTITITVGYTATIMLVSAGDASMSGSGAIDLTLNRNNNQIQGLTVDAPTGGPRQAIGVTAADIVGPGTYAYDARIAPNIAVTANWSHFRMTAIVIPSP